MCCCRPLSPPGLRPSKAVDAQPDRAHSSASEIPVAPLSPGQTSMQPAESQAAQSKVQGTNAGSIEPDSSLLMHTGSSSALSEPSGVRKLPPAGRGGSEGSAAGSRALQAGIDSGSGSIPGEKSGAAYEPGYREGSNAQPAPWPHDAVVDGSAVSAVRQVRRAQQLQHELHRKHARLAVRHAVPMAMMLACVTFCSSTAQPQDGWKSQTRGCLEPGKHSRRALIGLRRVVLCVGSRARTEALLAPWPARQAVRAGGALHTGAAGSCACSSPGRNGRRLPGILHWPHWHPEDLQCQDRLTGAGTTITNMATAVTMYDLSICSCIM